MGRLLHKGGGGNAVEKLEGKSDIIGEGIFYFCLIGKA